MLLSLSLLFWVEQRCFLHWSQVSTPFRLPPLVIIIKSFYLSTVLSSTLKLLWLPLCLIRTRSELSEPIGPFSGWLTKMNWSTAEHRRHTNWRNGAVGASRNETNAVNRTVACGRHNLEWLRSIATQNAAVRGTAAVMGHLNYYRLHLWRWRKEKGCCYFP